MANWTPISAWKPIAGSGQNITLSSASTQSAAVGAHTQAVALSATGDCHVAVGANPTATVTDLLIQGGLGAQVIGIGPGDKVAVINDSASTGTLNIVEMTH